MDLKDFISQTLIQIVDGVSDAQENIRNKGGVVNPAVTSTEVGTITANWQVLQQIDFNVAITVTEDSSISGGGKLSVASVFKANAETASSEKNSTTSNISFRIPLAIPIDSVSLEEMKKRKEKSRGYSK